MKKSELSQAIKKLKRVISNKSTMPILDNILNDNGKMRVSNLEVDYTINTGFDGKFLIDFRQLDKIVSKLPANADIGIYDDGERINITTNRGAQFGLPITNIDEFPTLVECKEFIGSLDPDTIQLIKKATKFVANDELRPIMNCVYLCDRVVASDANRLVFYDYVKNLSSDILIQPQVIRTMNEDIYTVSVDKITEPRYIRIAGKDEEITFRETEGVFPQYKSVIPKKNFNTYRLEKTELQECIKLGIIAANAASGLIKFKFTQFSLNISSQDLDFEISFSQNVSCRAIGKKTKDITIGMKGTFLLDLIQDCDEKIRIKMQDPTRAILIDDNKLLMPMLLTE